MKISIKSRKNLLEKVQKPKTSRKSTPRSLKTTSKKSKAKKSILDKVIPKKTPKTFGIYTIKDDKVYFVRFVAKQDDSLHVYYDITFVTKVDECSKFISMESAKQRIEQIKNSRKFNFELKAIECGKVK